MTDIQEPQRTVIAWITVIAYGGVILMILLCGAAITARAWGLI